MARASETRPPPERFALIGISLTVASAALAVVGVVFLTDCGPQTFPAGPPLTSVCTYPLQWYGIETLYAALIPLPLLALYSYLRYEAEKGPGRVARDRPIGALVMLGAAATLLFWVIAVVVLIPRG